MSLHHQFGMSQELIAEVQKECRDTFKMVLKKNHLNDLEYSEMLLKTNLLPISLH